MAAVPLAGRVVVFHYPGLSQSLMSPRLERPGVAWRGGARRQAVRRVDASSRLDYLADD